MGHSRTSIAREAGMRFQILRVSAVVFAAVAGGTLAADAPTVTFHKDVEPILQKNCQTCHRPGQVAPMSFMTYDAVRPYARAMKTAVASRKMPPWFADPHYGPYLNDRSLTEREIQTDRQLGGRRRARRRPRRRAARSAVA